jgi:MGT family glycosyltransferase
MRRRHIALFTILNNGHVYPALGLCAELVKRGYRVTYATDQHYAPLVHEVGAEPVIFKPARFEDAEQLIRLCSLSPPGWWTIYATVCYPLLLLEAAAVVAQLEGVYRKDVPDLILYDRIAYGGRILAERLHSSAMQIFPHFACYERFLYREQGACVTPAPMLSFSRSLDTFLLAYGIDGEDNLWHSEPRNIYFVPRAFQYHAESFDERYCFVGPCLGRSFRSAWNNRGGGKPIILISDLSTIGDATYFNAFTAALSELDCHVVLSIGTQLPESALQSLPPNFEINRLASHLEILPHTTLSICQAGMGSTLEAIYHGVPVIALPLTPYHEEIAYRMAELGLGINCPRPTMSAEVIRNHVERVLADTALRNRVRRMEQVFRDSGGAAKAVDNIDEYLGVGRAVGL